MSSKKAKLKSADFPLFIVTLAIIIFGLIMVFSASYYWSIDKMGTPYSFLVKDGVFVIIGFFLMISTLVIDYHKYKKFAFIILIGSLVLLGLIFTPLGVELNGATRWLNFGLFTIMPGEIAKISAIIYVAHFLSTGKNRVNSLTSGVIPMLFLCGLYGGLIMLQPNMSTAITIVVIIVGMMFVAGLKIRYLAGMGAAGATAMIMLIFSGGGYRLDRVTSFLDPFKYSQGEGYQVVQSLLALGSGGLFGVGLGNSVQKSLYLPEPQNDFILAIIGEELGFIAITVLLFAYLFMVWRGIKIAINAPDKFGMLLASGITMMIGVQVLLNVAVVTSSMPPTGVILPFISYGGNALWLFMLSMGILLNISRQTKEEK